MNARILTKDALPVLKSSFKKWFERDVFHCRGYLLIVINLADFYDKEEVTTRLVHKQVACWSVRPNRIFCRYLKKRKRKNER